ncbi:MAG: hypothetical protein GEU74_10665 [Nitriliruptorales bacterium]|nr:hypothetical protein [Nitriliruptorales bacterium]
MLLGSGALLGVVGNVFHPVLDPGLSTQAFLDAVHAAPWWRALHLLITLSVVLLTAGLVLLARRLVSPPGGDAARVTAVLALIGGTLFVAVIGAVDGAAMSALADVSAGAPGQDVIVAAAAGLRAMDNGLLSLVVALFMGGTFVALGAALRAGTSFGAWLRWSSLVIGGAGIGTGTLMFLGVAAEFTNYTFRVVALGVTVVALALAIQVLRLGPSSRH